MKNPNLSFTKFIIVLLVVIVVLILLVRFVKRRTPELSGPARPMRAGRVLPGAPASALPEMSAKPQPIEITYKECPPEGDNQNQADLNNLKNRVDEGDYAPVQFDAVANLTWPPGIERQRRANWSASDAAAIDKYQGIPVAVEGYLAGSKEEGPESPNCHGDDHEFRDFHVWLTKSAGDDRSRSIIVEVTPRVRANHPSWRTDVLGQLVRNKQRVRISGWLMMDPEHPDQVGKTRATIWEVHPVMQIEVQQQGQWIPLDQFGG